MTEIKLGRTPHSLPRRSNSPRRNAVKTGAKTGTFRSVNSLFHIHFGMEGGTGHRPVLSGNLGIFIFLPCAAINPSWIRLTN